MQKQQFEKHVDCKWRKFICGLKASTRGAGACADSLQGQRLWQALFLCSQSTLLKSLQAHAVHGRDTQDGLALVAKEGCVYDPKGLKQLERQFLGDYYPLGTAQTADWRTPPGFLYEALSWSFSLRRGLQVCHISTGCGGVGRHGPRDTIFVLSISLATDWQYLPERSLYTHLRPQFLWPSPREHVYISSSGGQRIFNCTPARLCLIACFKSCCLNGTEQRARNKPIPIWLIHLFQRRWEYKNGEKAVSLINSVGKTGHLHAKEWNWIIMLHHTQK